MYGSVRLRWGSIVFAAATTLALVCAEPAQSASVLFSDNFNRPDGSVGNGWTDAPDTFGRTLNLKNGHVEAPGPGGLPAIFRPVDFSRGVSASASFGQVNGYGGLPSAFNSSFLFQSNGTVDSGYAVNFHRSDINYANSSISLLKDGAVIANVASGLQFTADISSTVSFTADGHIFGSVSEGGNSFDFDFGTHDLLAGGQFGLSQGGPDERSSTFLLGEVDDLVLSAADTQRYNVNLQPSGSDMYATFTPLDGLSLEQAAALDGFDHFNWYQIGLEYPFRETPFVDPPPGGWNGQPSDQLPFYWDEGNESGLLPEYHLDANIFGGTLLQFTDIPGNSFLLPGQFMKFNTALVGVRGDGSWTPLFSWNWKSNNRPFLPGDVVLTRNVHPIPGFDGDVFDLEPFVDPSQAPAHVRRLWIEAGATGVAAVPEPRTWLLTIVGFCLIGSRLRRSSSALASFA